MTTVIAVKTRNGIIFGSDSQVTAGLRKATLAEGKFFSNGALTVGSAGAVSVIQKFQHGDVPQPEGEDAAQYVARTLIPYLQNLEAGLGAEGYSSFLVAVGGRLFEVHPQECYLETTGAQAIGSGANYALGYLRSINGNITERDVTAALKAAAAVDAGTSGPFHVRTVK